MTPPALRVFSTLALAGALDELSPSFRGARLETTLLPTTLIAERIRAGERADVAILSSAAIDELAREGFLEPGRTDLVKSLVGIAVRTGAPRPDISTVDGLVATLLAARSVAMSRAGASGIAFAALLQRLGIAGQVKTVVIPSGFTAELAARGEAELAVQQISELMAVPGVEVVGAFPPGAECAAVFSAGVSACGAMQAEARAFIAMLASDAAASAFRANGLEPVAKLA
jgi:molybdate transport system substrate-binding protein